MFTIGDFARLGRVSVPMLRHHDAIGLLIPAQVDPDSAYRFYTVDRLARLNRLLALKDLGFKLEQVQVMLDDAVGAEELATAYAASDSPGRSRCSARRTPTAGSGSSRW